MLHRVILHGLVREAREELVHVLNAAHAAHLRGHIYIAPRQLQSLNHRRTHASNVVRYLRGFCGTDHCAEHD